MIKIFIHPHTTNDFQVKWCCPRTELLVLEGLRKLSNVKLVDSEKESDYVIFHHVPQNSGQKSFELINQIDVKKLIVVDSIDENDQYFIEHFHPDNYFLYFKRSILKVNADGSKVKLDLPERCFPWDYGILDGFTQPSYEKTIDIGCYIRPSCYNRALLIHLMKQYPHLNKIVGEISSGSRSTDDKVYYDPYYFYHLAKTKIIVSSGPYAWTGDSRPSEAFANKCLFISDEAYRFMPNSPIDGEHWIKWNTLVPESLFDWLDYALSNPEIVNMMADDGYYHAKQHHSSEARANYIIDKIKEYS